MHGYVTLGKGFEFRCKDVELFPKQNSRKYDMSSVESDILYHVHEKVDGATSRPLFDLYFCTKDKELVLIDYTGGKDTEEKKKAISEWIRKEQPKVTNFKLRGVVLAPFASGGSKQRGPVCVIQGQVGQQLLGGFAQVFRWL